MVLMLWLDEPENRKGENRGLDRTIAGRGPCRMAGLGATYVESCYR